MHSSFEIVNCYDSHTHFLATGQIACGLQLNHLSQADDILKLKIVEDYYRGSWLYGFGWNNHNWSDTNWPNIKILDQAFPDRPVFLSRVDGHASWINSKALIELKNNGFNFEVDPPGGIIGRDSKGNPNGILIDQAHIKALLMLPAYHKNQIKNHLLKSMNIFNQAGFTHIRDLSMTLEQAEVLTEIYHEKKQSVCIEGFVTIESLADLERGYREFLNIKSLENPYIKMKGLKIFVDGSLGSESAFISKPYDKDLGNSDVNAESQNFGLLIWSAEEIYQFIQFCWTHKIEVALHAIGDASADVIIDQARLLSSQGVLGLIHLEHAQLLKPETIQKMKPLHIRCHMQPCHWLSDRTWIKDKIGDLYPYLFQWNQLTKNKISLSFGSDSPIEKPSLFDNWMAIQDASANEIEPIQFIQFITYHSNSDKKWGPSKSVFENGQLKNLYFDGKKII